MNPRYRPPFARRILAAILALIGLLAPLASANAQSGSTAGTLTLQQNRLIVSSNPTNTDQFLVDFNNFNPVGGGSALRFFDLDQSSPTPQLREGAVINCGLASNAANNWHGDCDLVTYKPDAITGQPTPETCISLTAVGGFGLLPCSADSYDLGASTMPWRTVYAQTLDATGVSVNGGNLAVAPLPVMFDSSGFAGILVQSSNNSPDGPPILFRNSAGTTVGAIEYNSTQTGIAYQTTSDARLKTIDGKLDADKAFDGLDAVRFTWKSSNQPDVGFIAQDVAKVAPEAVKVGDNQPDTKPGDTGFRPWLLDKTGLVPYLWAAVKQLREREAEDRSVIAALTKRLDHANKP